MSESRKNGFGRREFLKKSAGTAAIVGCFSRAGLRAALAQAKQAAKPLLTEANINAHIPPVKDLTAFRAWADEVKQDPKAYLDNHFHITLEQREEIDAALDRRTVRQISEGLDRCVRERKPVRVTIIARRAERAFPPAPLLRNRLGYASMLKPKLDIHIGADGFSIKYTK
jgi:hypothetical protein